jgi:hypothetical protein
MFLTDDELHKKLIQKLEICEKIRLNTKLQIEFIRQRKIKGLLRLLNERAGYLKEVDVISQSLRGVDLSGNTGLQSVKKQLEDKCREIMKDNDTALEAAKSEQASIAADLRRVNARRQLQNKYDYQWIQFSGHRLSRKG